MLYCNKCVCHAGTSTGISILLALHKVISSKDGNLCTDKCQLVCFGGWTVGLALVVYWFYPCHGKMFNHQSWTTQATRPWNTKECHFFYWETSSFKQLNPTGCSMLTRGLGKAAILPWRFSELDARHLLEKVTAFGRLLDGMYLEPKWGTWFFCWYFWGGWSFKHGGHWGSRYVWMDEMGSG